MKHIFSVHSPITFLISHAVIEYLQLDLADVIILSNKYKVPIQKYRTFPFLANLNNNWIRKIRYMNTPLWEDRYLDKIIGSDEFIAYIDLMSYHQRVIITHSNCRGFHFIEEGSASYRDHDILNDLTWDKRHQPYRIHGIGQIIKEMIVASKGALRGYSQRLISIPYSYTNYSFYEGVKYFGFSELTHPSVNPSKRVVVPLRHSDDLNLLAGNMQLSNCVIWLDGSGKSFTQLPDEFYYHAIDKGIEKLYIKLADKKHYVKFKPGTTNPHESYLYAALKKRNFDVEIMPNDLIIECVFANSADCTVVGNLSSALFYASIFGHKSYSIYPLFEKRVPTFYDQISGFWSKVVQLN